MTVLQLVEDAIGAAMEELFARNPSGVPRDAVVAAVMRNVRPYLRNRYQLRCASTQEDLDRGVFVVDVIDHAEGRAIGMDGLFHNLETEGLIAA